MAVQPTHGARIRHLLINSALALFTFALLAVACEIAFWVKFHREYGRLGYSKAFVARGRVQDSPFSVFEPIPGAIHISAKYRQNNYGFRNENDVEPKKPNEYRVFLMGGSAALGQGSMPSFLQITVFQEYATEHTITAMLEKLLQEQHPDKTIRVFNAAVSGFTTAQEYLFYLSTVRKLSPDLVILFDGYNDAFCYSPGSKAEYRWDIDRRAWEMHPWKTDPIRVWGTRLMGASYTLFYLGKLSFDFGHRINESTRSKRLNYSGDVDRKGLRTYYMENLQGYRTCVRDTVKRYTIFAKTAGVDGVNILFTSQPILTLKPHKTDNERACYNLLLQGLRVTPDEQVPYFDYYEDFLATMRSWAVQNDQDYIDFQNVVNQKADEIFVDYCHLSFAGNRLVAETLARFINAHHLAGKGGTTTITGSPHVVNGSVN